LAKASVRGRLIAPAVLIDEKSRYDHRWTRRGRIISESLRYIASKLCWEITKYRKAELQNLVERRNQLLFLRPTYYDIWFDAGQRADSEYYLGFAKQCLCIRKTKDSGAGS
jgi:hypothetical protein